jgi:hypothetical protein
VRRGVTDPCPVPVPELVNSEEQPPSLIHTRTQYGVLAVNVYAGLKLIGMTSWPLSTVYVLFAPGITGPGLLLMLSCDNKAPVMVALPEH